MDFISGGEGKMKGVGHTKRQERRSDDEWIREHLEELIDRYAGKYVVVAEGEIFVGEDAAALEKEARKSIPILSPRVYPFLVRKISHAFSSFSLFSV